MNAPLIALTRRLRSTPWTTRIEAFGVRAYTVYNHMLLPTQIRGAEAEVWSFAIQGPRADDVTAEV